jgi:branched-chain amino acid transport system substrate-binding protein
MKSHVVLGGVQALRMRGPARVSARTPSLAALVLLSVLVPGGCKREFRHNDATGDIVVGGYFSLTGPTADFGVKTKQGLDMAFDEANQSGGAHGRRLQLVVLDDQGKADETGNAVTRLIDMQGAVAMLGETTSGLSLIGGRICERKKVPMVSTSSTNVEVTRIGPHVFRACFIDPFQGQSMAKFMWDHRGIRRAAIFKDVRSDYSVGLAEAFHSAFTAMGGTIEANLSYHQGDTDFGAQLTTLRGSSAQALYVPGYYGEVGNIARQARRLGVTIPMFGGDGWDSPELRTIGGADIVGSYYTTDFSPETPYPRTREFTEAYKRRFGDVPSGLGAQGYEAATMLIDAIRRAPVVSPEAIRDALANTHNFMGVTGPISMDPNRDPIKPIVVMRVGAHEDEFQAVIEP